MSGKTPSCKTPFQHLHTIEFGLQITGRDAKSQVVSVLCRFCTSFKQTEKEGAKRQCTDNTKYNSAPICKETLTNTTVHSTVLNESSTRKRQRKKRYIPQALTLDRL